MNQDKYYLNIAIEQAILGVKNKEGGPFGAVIVKNGVILAQSNNRVLITKDPTAHAEMVAIKEACANLGSFQLNECVLYASCEPCPMCLGAIYWARPVRLVYASTRFDAAEIGFDDSMIYEQIQLPAEKRIIQTKHMHLMNSTEPFNWWKEWGDKDLY